ncbi:MAG: hypothetical protein HWE10_01850 [Gammaproteobacteria bacterium]|nr:hypothetical protein [Gammaproteobacteria bacterium]
MFKASFWIIVVLFCGTSTAKSNQQWHRILILNDINRSYGSVGYSEPVKKMVSHAINQWQVSYVISPGDLVAGQSLKLNSQQLHAMWAGFEQQILSQFRSNNIPFFLP